MAVQLQLRRGTTAENEGFTGATAEVTVDTDTHELRVHDGSTQGGFVIPTKAETQEKAKCVVSGEHNYISTGADVADNLVALDTQLKSTNDTVGNKADQATTLAGYGITDGADTDLSNLTSTGKANISKQGTYDPNETYNAGTVGEAITGKANTSLDNISAGIDFVVEFQAPTAANNHTWYRKYKSGWVEQGGRVQLNGTISATNKRVTFPVEMATSKYIARVDNNANVGAVAYVGWESTTGMSVGLSSGSSTGETSWEVKGMASS